MRRPVPPGRSAGRARRTARVRQRKSAKWQTQTHTHVRRELAQPLGSRSGTSGRRLAERDAHEQERRADAERRRVDDASPGAGELIRRRRGGAGDRGDVAGERHQTVRLLERAGLTARGRAPQAGPEPPRRRRPRRAPGARSPRGLSALDGHCGRGDAASDVDASITCSRQPAAGRRRRRETAMLAIVGQRARRQRRRGLLDREHRERQADGAEPVASPRQPG
jgi:hypothetical protein